MQFGSGPSSRWHRLRALKRLLNGERALGRCIQVCRLSTVLKGIANDKVTKWSVAFAEAASLRPNCVSGDTDGSVKMAKLCNALLDELLSPVA